MPDYETPAERYRRLAQECLDVANNVPLGDHRDALIEMAQVWERLADEYRDATFSRIGRHATATAKQPDDDKKD